MSRRRTVAVSSEDGGRDRSDLLFVTALSRGLDILSAFSPARPELTVREIAETTELPYPTVWRLCFTLEKCGYLVTLPENGKLCPSARVLTLGHAAVSRYPVADVVYPHMQAMSKRYKVGMSLGTRVGTEMVYLRRTYSSFVAFTRSALPIPGAPSGWAVLAASGSAERESLLQQLRAAYPEHWSQFKRSFDKALAGYERDGYLVIPEITKVFPYMRDVMATCISVPIRGGSGNEILGLSCASSPKILTEAKYRELGEALLGISRMMAPVHA